MDWRLRFALLGCLAAFGEPSTPALAADAYLCGSDNVVYVEIDNLEEMKRTDPCIAAYYGLKVAPQPPAAAKPAAVTRASDHRDPKKTAKRAGASVKLRPLLVSDGDESRTAGAPAISTKSPAPVVAAEGTDYRNVRVINAKSPNDAWLRRPR